MEERQGDDEPIVFLRRRNYCSNARTSPHKGSGEAVPCGWKLLAQFCCNRPLGSRPMLIRAALKTMLLGNKVSGCLHHAVAFFGGWLYGRLAFGGRRLCLGGRCLLRRSFGFCSRGRHFFYCGSFGLFGSETAA